jgi:hypothetical protein
MRAHPAGALLDPLEPVIRKLLDEVADIKEPRVCETLRDDYGYTGSVDLVRKRDGAAQAAGGAAGAADGLSARAGDAGRWRTSTSPPSPAPKSR